MKYSPSDFHDVVPGTFISYPVSPVKPTMDWKGILINVPEKLVCSRQELPILPLSGYYYLSNHTIGNQKEPMKFVLEHQETSNRFEGLYVIDNPHPSSPDPIVEKDTEVSHDKIEQFIGIYFNPNVLEFVSLPFKSGTYSIQVLWGELESNKVLIEVERY